MRKRLLSLVLIAVATTAVAQPTAPRDVPKIPIETFTLPNGLKVILHVDRKLPMVSVNQWFHVGSKVERRGLTGFAHLFEHLMFEGSKNASQQYFSYAEAAGANQWEQAVNGTTNQDRTNYFINAPAASLEYLLWLESDRLATLNEALTQEKLDAQRSVVRNERRQRLENVPYGRWYQLLFENIYPADHPYSWPVIGYHEDLEAATVEDVRAYFARYYTPNNLSLAIAGDFDPAVARKLVEKYFGSIAPGPALERRKRWYASLSEEKVVEAFDRVPQARLFIAWPAPELYSADYAPLQMLTTILGDGLESRLQKALIYDSELATNATASYWPKEIAGEFIVNATAREGVTLDRLDEVITREISRIAKTGPTTSELERARTGQEYRFITALERLGGFGGKADLLNAYQTYLGTPHFFESELARYRAVSVSDVRNAAARWLDEVKRLVIRFHPENLQPGNASVLDRAAVPSLGGEDKFVAPEVKSAKLENGLEVLVVERPDLPKVAVLLATRASIGRDPVDKSGTASLVVRTIDFGTTTRTALEIENALSTLGARLTGAAGIETTEIGVEVLSRHLAKAMEVFADVVRNPTFPEKEVTRERTRALEALKQRLNDPTLLTLGLHNLLGFGSRHPYARPEHGYTGTVVRISREDLAGFHRDYFKPGSSVIIFAGDVTLDEATSLVKTHFGTWSGGAAAAVPMPQPKTRTGIYVVDHPNAPQTVISQLLLAPSRSSGEIWPVQIADTIWGGNVGSRLNQNLRQQKGYSYGAYSVAIHLSHAGLWKTLGSVQTDKTRESVVEFMRELRDIAGARPITDAEVKSAKAFRIRSYAQGFESVRRVTEQIADLWRTGVPMKELRRDPEHIAATTLEATRAAAAKYISPERMALLLVGDLSKIEPQLRGLKLGEISVIDAEGNVLRTIPPE